MVSWEAGWAPLFYVTFKNGLTARNCPRELGRSVGYETLCSRKVRLSCSGLEWCSTDAVQHSLQRAKPPSPKEVLGCKTISLKRSFGCKTPSPKRSVGLQNPNA